MQLHIYICTFVYVYIHMYICICRCSYEIHVNQHTDLIAETDWSSSWSVYIYIIWINNYMQSHIYIYI
jgi:hypothetical protein